MPDSIDPAAPRERCLKGNSSQRSDDEFRLNAVMAKALDQPVRVEVIVSHAEDAVGGYQNSAGARELAAVLLAGGGVTAGSGPYVLKINEYRTVVQSPVCVDCDQGFHPDSSPHVDRCWACAERDDEESGR